jgi:hypothetical protein
MSNVLDGMISQGSVQADATMVMCRKSTVHGIDRTMLGGLILHGMNIPETEKGWMRWRGSVILIPEVIERNRDPSAYRMDQMITGLLNVELDNNYAERAKKTADSFWQPTWWNKS